MIFVTIRDERYGLISYFKNFFFKTLVIAFVSIYFIFVGLLIYFWISVLSLHTNLKRAKNRGKHSNGAFVVENASGILNEGLQDDNNNNDASSGNNIPTTSTADHAARNSNSIQMIPISLSKKDMKDNGKIFIIRV